MCLIRGPAVDARPVAAPTLCWIGGELVPQNNCSRDDILLLADIHLDSSNRYHAVYKLDTLIAGDDEFDLSQFPFPNELWLIKPTWEIVVKALAFLPVMIGGILGNLAVLNAVRTNRLLRAAPINLFIANMAACDLCALLLGPWMLMCNDSFQNFVLGEFFCKTEGFVQSSLLLGGVMSLTAVSYDRLVAIVFPRKPRLGIWAAWVVVGSTWLIGVAMSVPLILYRHYNERQWKNFLECYCTEDTKVLATYWYVMIAVLVWLPLMMMLLCYSAIFLKLDRYARQASKSPHPITTASDYRSRVTRMVLVLVLVFIVCRVPFTALIYIRNDNFLHSASQNQVDEQFRILWYTAHYLIYTNAAINPVIYGMTNEAFRRALRGAWPCFRETVSPQVQSPAAAIQQPVQRVLQPREPYHLEPCWRPSHSNQPYVIKVNSCVRFTAPICHTPAFVLDKK